MIISISFHKTYCFNCFTWIEILILAFRCSPSPQRPSGIAFSWIGEGFWKPEEDNPSRTGWDSSRELKYIPSDNSTSSVLFRTSMSCAARFMGAAMLNVYHRQWTEEDGCFKELWALSGRPLVSRLWKVIFFFFVLQHLNARYCYLQVRIGNYIMIKMPTKDMRS